MVSLERWTIQPYRSSHYDRSLGQIVFGIFMGRWKHVKTVLPACLGKIVASTCWWSSSTVPLLGANSPNIIVWCLGKLLPGQLLREGFGNSSGWRPAKGGLRCHLKKVLVLLFLEDVFLNVVTLSPSLPLENWGRWLTTDEHIFYIIGVGKTTNIVM